MNNTIIYIVIAVFGVGGSIFFGINNQHLKLENKQIKEQRKMWQDSTQTLIKKEKEIQKRLDAVSIAYEKKKDQPIRIDTISSDSAVIAWFRSRFR